MNLRAYSLLSRAAQYRRVFILTMLLSVIAVLPIAQRAEHHFQGLQRQLPEWTIQRNKKDHLNAVPGEILVRFRPESKVKRLGTQVLIEKTGRQISMSIKAVSP